MTNWLTLELVDKPRLKMRKWLKQMDDKVISLTVSTGIGKIEILSLSALLN